jgi:hypothetical protein
MNRERDSGQLASWSASQLARTTEAALCGARWTLHHPRSGPASKPAAQQASGPEA